MALILRYKRHILLFIWCIATSFLIYYLPSGPIYHDDTDSYLNIAKQISNIKQLPSFSIRTPSYPIYLSFFYTFNIFSLLIPVTFIVNSIGALFYLWFLDKISRFKWLNIIIIGFIFTFIANQYQNTILTESIASTAIILSVFFNFKLKEISFKSSKKIFFLSLFFDSFLMFLKPHFVILPLIIKTFLLIQKIIFKKKFKINTKLILVSVLINLILIISLPLYNYLNNRHKFEISCISTINRYLLYGELGFLDPNPMYKNMSQEISAIMKGRLHESISQYITSVADGYQQPNRGSNGAITFCNKNFQDGYVRANKYFFSYPQNRYKYIKYIITTIPKNFNKSKTYVKTNLESAITKFFIPVFTFNSNLNNFKFIAFLLVFFIYLYLTIKKNPKSVYLGMALVIVFYIITTITAFAPYDFERLNQPAQFFMSLFIFLPFLLL